MLIVQLDEPGLFVFESLDDAVRQIEPPDAEGSLRAAFDELAVPHVVEWLRPNRSRRGLLGLWNSVEFGEYRFVPAGPPDPAALVRLLESHEAADPPDAVDEKVAELLGRYRATE